MADVAGAESVGAQRAVGCNGGGRVRRAELEDETGASKPEDNGSIRNDSVLNDSVAVRAGGAESRKVPRGAGFQIADLRWQIGMRRATAGQRQQPARLAYFAA